MSVNNRELISKHQDRSPWLLDKYLAKSATTLGALRRFTQGNRQVQQVLAGSFPMQVCLHNHGIINVS